MKSAWVVVCLLVLQSTLATAKEGIHSPSKKRSSNFWLDRVKDATKGIIVFRSILPAAMLGNKLCGDHSLHGHGFNSKRVGARQALLKTTLSACAVGAVSGALIMPVVRKIERLCGCSEATIKVALALGGASLGYLFHHSMYHTYRHRLHGNASKGRHKIVSMLLPALLLPALRVATARI